jgi:hypothetical protein
MLRNDKYSGYKTDVSLQWSILISGGGCLLETNVCFLDNFLILFNSLDSFLFSFALA